MIWGWTLELSGIQKSRLDDLGVDPGIVRRYREKPVNIDVEAGSVAPGAANYGTSGGASEGEWIWCDNADTWRRNTAK